MYPSRSSCVVVSSDYHIAVTPGKMRMVVCVQVMQAKKQLLDKLHAEVADKEDVPLKRMLCEDDGTMKRREQCQQRVQLLKKAAEEIASVSF